MSESHAFLSRLSDLTSLAMFPGAQGLSSFFPTSSSLGSSLASHPAVRQLVVTAVGPDRPGLVSNLTKRVLESGGNVEESRMARLAGKSTLGSSNASSLLIAAPQTVSSQAGTARFLTTVNHCGMDALCPWCLSCIAVPMGHIVHHAHSSGPHHLPWTVFGVRCVSALCCRGVLGNHGGVRRRFSAQDFRGAQAAPA